MYDWFFELLKDTAEGKEGTLALVFLGITMVLTIWPQLPGTLSQMRVVFDPAQSIADLDTPLMIALSGYFLVFLIYAIHTRSVGGVFNVAVLGPIFWLTTARLNKRRPFIFRERMLVYQIGLLSVIAVAHPELTYIIASLVLMLFPCLQMYKIWNKGTAEGVKPGLWVSYSFVCGVWAAYGYEIRDHFIMFVAGTFVFLYGGIVVAWWKPQLLHPLCSRSARA